MRTILWYVQGDGEEVAETAEVAPAEVAPAEVTPAEVAPAEVTPAEVAPAMDATAMAVETAQRVETPAAEPVEPKVGYWVIVGGAGAS